MATREKEREQTGRVLESVQVGDYTLLNNEKLGRVLDLLEGIEEPRDSRESSALSQVNDFDRDDAILALYDRLGGAIKVDGRKLLMGVFWDFKAREPKQNVKISDENFADEFVLVRKTSQKAGKKETTSQRVKRLEKKSTKTTAKKSTKK